MATSNTPSSQRYKQIALALHDGTNPVKLFVLPVRPEEYTRNEPARITAINSLDGAWVDSFGRGLATVTMTGNTGWRSNGASGLDGAASFISLRDEVINAWHTLRSARIDAGLDPADVRMILIDSLNGGYVADVVPMSFVLRRSKSTPLLMNYNLSLTVTSDKAENPYPEVMNENDPQASLTSALSSISLIASIQSKIGEAMGVIGGLAKQVSDFTKKTLGPIMTLAGDVMRTVNAAKGLITAASGIVLNLAADLAAVGQAVWGAVASVASLPNALLAEVMKIKSAFSNLVCVIKNGYKSVYQAVDYSDMYGASNCSSTSGGRPASAPADMNPFASATEALPVSVDIGATTAISSVKSADKAAPVQVDSLSRDIQSINGGVTIYA